MASRKTSKRAKSAAKRTSTKSRPKAKRTTKATSRKRTGTRELLRNSGGSFYARRSRTGQFSELDEQGRAGASDRRTRAKTPAKRGQGDRGDRKK